MTATAFAACALMALPAVAADLHVAHSASSVVRIQVAGKTHDQVRQEIAAAAVKVCGDAGANCVDDARYDGERQLRELDARAHPVNRIEVARNDPNTVRISLKGKTRAQIEQEIDAAAVKVCKGASIAEERECKTQASADAKRRLAEAGAVGALAFND